MKLIMFNGSPRGKLSNSDFIANWFLTPLRGKLETEYLYLNNIQQHDAYIDKIKEADIIVFVLPLYTDCMPAIFKCFIEKLEIFNNKLSNKTIGYIIHSGFFESFQSKQLSIYLEYLTTLLGAKPAGIAIMGGSEGIRRRRPQKLKKKQKLFNQLGEMFLETGVFDPLICKRLYDINKMIGYLFKYLYRFQFINFYWNRRLTENNAYEKRLDAPYIKQ
jgi:multimeric flavodoxin WrbA